MRIAIVGTLANATLNFRRTLIVKLANKGHKVYVFCTNIDEVSFSQLKALGAEPVYYRLNRSGLNPIEDIRSCLSLSFKFKERKIESVLSYFSKPVIIGTLAAFFAKVKIRIAMLEGLGFPFTKQPEGFCLKTFFVRVTQRFLYSLALPLASFVVFLNKDDMNDIRPCFFFRSKSLILGPIGVDLNKYVHIKPRIESQVRFLFVGRLVREKGIFEFIEAAKKVITKKSNVVFEVVGTIETTSPNSYPVTLLQRYERGGLIKFSGHLDDMHSAYSRSHVLVLPSYREGFPRSIQESMATGRAVIATNVPGCKSAINDGFDGFLIEPFDVDGLVSKMLFFLETPEHIVSMGSNARVTAETSFNVDPADNKLIGVILGQTV